MKNAVYWSNRDLCELLELSETIILSTGVNNVSNLCNKEYAMLFNKCNSNYVVIYHISINSSSRNLKREKSTWNNLIILNDQDFHTLCNPNMLRNVFPMTLRDLDRPWATLDDKSASIRIQHRESSGKLKYSKDWSPFSASNATNYSSDIFNRATVNPAVL